MEAIATKLLNRDFALLIFGQIISIFGNMILSFALPLFVLDISGSPALYGVVMGVPYITLLLMTPIGGIIADRLRKQRVMFWLDASTTALIVLYMIVSGMTAHVIPVIVVKLLALNGIQAMYIPAVQSSVPLLVPNDKLTTGNAVTGVVNSLSGMIGMAAAGVLYGWFGLTPILIVSAACFAVTAVMDLLIRIPYEKQSNSGGMVNIVKNDLSQAINFVTKEKPVLAKSVIVIFLLVLLLTSILIVGMPVLVHQHLGLGMEYVGMNQSIMMAGGLIGGIAAGALGTRLTIPKSLLAIAVGSIFVAAVGLVFLVKTSVMFTFVTITAASAMVLVTLQLFQIAAITFVQRETPTQLTGKVLSMMMILPFLAQAVGQILYGALFEQLAEMPWTIAFGTAALIAIVALFSHRVFDEAGERPANTR